MASDMRLNILLAPGRNRRCPDFPTTFENGSHYSLALESSGGDAALPLAQVHVPRLAADESFIGFDFDAGATEFIERASLGRQSDTVKHEPCGFLSDAKCAAHFIGTDTVLRVH